MRSRISRTAGVLLACVVVGMVAHATRINAGERASLELQVLELTHRVAALESRQAPPASIKAPFKVTGADGKTLFQVVDNIAEAPFGRVTVAGSGTGHSVLFVSSDEKVGGAGALITGEPGGRGAVTIRNTNGDVLVRMAEGPSGTGHFTVNDKSKRSLFLVTPDFAGASWARVTVGGAMNSSALMVSNDGKLGGAGVLLVAEGEGGGMMVRHSSGRTLASMTGKEFGNVRLSDNAGKERIVLDREGVRLNDETERAVVRILDKKPASGEQATVTISGGADGGAVRVTNPTGTVVAGMLGNVRNAGALLVADGSGKVASEMSVTSGGFGAIQVFGRTGAPVAVLGHSAEFQGGIVQISNTKGPVASLTIRPSGAGHFQLANAEGTPTVEAGTLQNGLGTVRAGPTYKCVPAQAGMGLGVPDCIIGQKPK